MRRIVIMSMAFVFAIGTVSAQREAQGKNGVESKNFTEILPYAGDWALGMDMATFAKSILGSITRPSAVNNPTVVAFQSDFFGKYFLTDKSALRIRLEVGIKNFTEREFVRDDAAWMLNPLIDDPILMERTVDVWKNRNTGIELGIGYEYRRTLWRVQGYVGAEVFGRIDIARDFFEYGNTMTELNQTPRTTNWGFNMNPLGRNSYRGLDAKTFGYTAGGGVFVGADLFICRNLSIGAEFNLDARYTRWNERTMKTETWKYDQAYTKEEKVKPVTSSFGLNPMGRLNLMIYF
jgi:hypothetical protein